MSEAWWKKAVVYQIYPKSFQDTNGDGIGDIRGIIQRLPYLKKLGIDAIWLSPMYVSPQYDNGYDIADYYHIQKEYGTMDEMKALIENAHHLNIKIIMDLVVNHTSYLHSWFQEAKKSKESPYHDYYVWRPADQGVPNELTSVFGGSAWEYNEATDEYYLHLFAKEQPDLNWENEKMRQEIYKMMNYWLDLGIDGFRMDVIDLIGKDPDRQITANGPKLHELIKEMHQATLSGRDVMTVGETWSATPEIARQFSSEKEKELSMVFQFEHIGLDQEEGKSKWESIPLDRIAFKQVFDKWQNALQDEGWNSLFLNNHDLPRMVSRFGDDGKYRVKSAKMLATLLHLQKGTPYIYQGEEIGLTNTTVSSIDEVDDIESRQFYEEYVSSWGEEKTLAAINKKGRDNARRPIPWTKEGGFSTGAPWLALNKHYKEINVEAALDDSDSIFYYYQALIRLRHQHDLVVYGDFYDVLPEHPDIYMFKRSYKGEEWLVVCNLSDHMVNDTPAMKVKEIILSNDCASNLDTTQFNPYEAVIYRCENE